jgi:hypothetical protein
LVWSDEHRAFVIEEFIQNGCSPIMTQRAYRICVALGLRDPVSDKKNNSQLGVELQTNRFCIKNETYCRPRTATGPETEAAVKADWTP